MRQQYADDSFIAQAAINVFERAEELGKVCCKAALILIDEYNKICAVKAPPFMPPPTTGGK